jgi:hypothetical protein
MDVFLELISGFCWTIVYIELIRLGFRDKTYGMPLFALALNISWESIQFFTDIFTAAITAQTWINLVWFLLDVVIIYTYFRYGKEEFPKSMNQNYFILWSIIVLITAFILEHVFIIQFGRDMGTQYSAFIQNLIMSVLFIGMLSRRTGAKGQNLNVAVSKCAGTVAPTILFGIIQGNYLILALGIFCFIFDAIYIYLLNAAVSTSFSRKVTLGVPG